MSFEGVDFIQREFALAERLDAFQDIDQPATRLKRFVSEKKRLLPFLKHSLFRTNDSVVNDMNLAGLRHLAEQNIRSDPARAERRRRKRLTRLNNIADKKVLRDDQEVHNSKRFPIIIHQ